MEDKMIMSFLNEEGNKVDFEAIAEIYLEEKKYLILAPIEDENQDDAYVFRVDKEDDKEVYNIVEDDEEFLKVNKEYKKLLYNEG